MNNGWLLFLDLAFGATEVDLLAVAVEEKNYDINIVPNAFMSLPSYVFPPPSPITVPVSMSDLAPFLLGCMT